MDVAEDRVGLMDLGSVSLFGASVLEGMVASSSGPPGVSASGPPGVPRAIFRAAVDLGSPKWARWIPGESEKNAGVQETELERHFYLWPHLL